MSEIATSTAPASTSAEVSTQNVETQQAASTEATPAEVKAQKEKFQYVIDGEQVEEEVDFSDKEALKKRFQLGHAAQKRMAEAKAAKAKAYEIVKAFEDDPANILERLGPKGLEAAEKFLMKKIQEQMKSPEEREYEMTKAELAKYKEQEKLAKEAEEKQKISAQEAKYAQEFQATIISALEKTGLPKTPDLVKRMAFIMSKNLELGLDLSPDELAQEVRKDQQELIKSLSKDASVEQLLEMLGPDIANKIRKYDLEKLKLKRNPVLSPDKPEVFENTEKRSKKPVSMDEWKAQIEERLRNG